MTQPAPAAEPSQAKKFACQACGAKVDFQPGSSSLHCPYCGNDTPIPQSEEDIKELDYEAFFAEVGPKEEQLTASTVKCSGCAADVVVQGTLAFTSCPFCNHNIKNEAAQQKLIKPKSLLPFAITKEKARELFKRWIASLWFAPNALKRDALGDSQIKGLYVPYWTYDCDTTCFYRGERGDDYWTTETYTTNENGRSVTKTRQVKRTRWTSVSGTVWNTFDDILILASRTLPKKYTDALEPWDLKELKPYDDDYVSGFQAEVYQVGLVEGFSEARVCMEPKIRSTICSDIGGDHQRISSMKTRYDDISFKHLLLPVWMSVYRFHGQVFRFLVNARTGEVQGERPYSWIKITLLVLAILCGLVVIGLFISANGGKHPHH